MNNFPMVNALFLLRNQLVFVSICLLIEKFMAERGKDTLYV